MKIGGKHPQVPRTRSFSKVLEHHMVSKTKVIPEVVTDKIQASPTTKMAKELQTFVALLGN